MHKLTTSLVVTLALAGLAACGQKEQQTPSAEKEHQKAVIDGLLKQDSLKYKAPRKDGSQSDPAGQRSTS